MNVNPYGPMKWDTQYEERWSPHARNPSEVMLLGQPRIFPGVPGLLRLERVVGEPVVAAAWHTVLRCGLGKPIEVGGQEGVRERPGAGIGLAFPRSRCAGLRRGRL